MINRTRVFRWLLVIAYAAAIFWVSSLSRPPLEIEQRFIDKPLHFVEFFLFGALLVWTVHARSAPRPGLVGICIVVGILYGASDEIHQMFVPGRVCELADVIADAAGAATGIFVWRRLAIKHERLR